jgi:cyclic pyranopterin phosphate synthase
MVDVGAKGETERTAVASGRVSMQAATVDLVREGRAAKGDVLAVAQVAAVMGAKRTPDLIPMCHPLMITKVDVTFVLETEAIGIQATVATRGRTGVEVEALTAVATAALTIYDMLKAVDRGMTIEEIRLERKEGGRSGLWERSVGEGSAPGACAMRRSSPRERSRSTRTRGSGGKRRSTVAKRRLKGWLRGIGGGTPAGP